MGTKTGLNGITFGDATVQNTAAVTGVSSAVAGSGISVSGSTGAVTFTNSGVTSIVAGTGISVSGGTGAVTVSASGGGVTSLNGQTGAITDTTFGNIGSIAIGYIQDGTQRLPGDTIAGSSVYYPNTNTGQTNGDPRNIVTAGNYADNVDSTVIYHFSANRASPTGGAYKAMQNMSTLSGTWRFMTHCGGRYYVGSTGCGFMNNYPGSLLVRVS
jgi:hypothetical protein